MGRYREDRDRFVVPDRNWKPGQDARVFDLDYTRQMRAPRPIEESWTNAADRLGDIEPYDPEKHAPHEPAELYSQNALDRLNRAGFEPHDSGVWHRPMINDQGTNIGTHYLSYEPGHKLDSGARAPWHLTTDPEDVGEVFPTLHRAIRAADQHAATIGKMAAKPSPGRANADDWLANNPDESFEHDPRQEAHDWMDQNSHLYDEWHPDPSDYTYPDFGDTAGQTFRGDESSSHVLPGSAYNFGHGESWEAPHDTQLMSVPSELHGFFGGGDDDDEEPEPNENEENLAMHGFDWEPIDPTAGSPENPYTPETPGRYFKYQHDLEGNHIAMHRITPGGHRPDQWTLETESTEHSLPVTFPTSIHGSLDWALHKYKQNSAESMLPRYGYERASTYGGNNQSGTHAWSRTTPNPSGQGPDYEHTIEFPENGFMGSTDNVSNGASFAPQGNVVHSSHDLADIVREQQRLEQGIHPGGARDFRLSRSELLDRPTVSNLGSPLTHTEPWDDGRVHRMTWQLPSPSRDEHHVNAEANYNWDTGNYDFRYTHNGSALAHGHNYVPAGAPITIPGRGTGW